MEKKRAGPLGSTGVVHMWGCGYVQGSQKAFLKMNIEQRPEGSKTAT